MIKLDYRNNRYLRVFLHCIFWIINQGYISFIYYLSQPNRTFNIKSFLEAGVGSIALIPCTYLIVYFLFPRLVLKKQNYLGFSLLYLIIISFSTIADPLAYIHFFIPAFRPHVMDTYLEYAFNIPFLLRLFYSKNIQIIIFFCVKFLLEFLRGNHLKENTKTEILNTELKMLKSQLHPHFLFNTLNNIYSLLLDKKRDQVSSSIDKITNILEFSINECDEQLIPLEKELKIINDYIELEKLRYSDININISLPNNTNEVKVIPLILFTLIENAFKHGTSRSIRDKWIKAELDISSDKLSFTVENSKASTNKNDKYGYSEGIGLQNMKKRLKLLVGENNFRLITKDYSDIYKAELTYKLI